MLENIINLEMLIISLVLYLIGSIPFAIISSKIFNGISKIEQHKLVYKSLQGKMGNELHALSITTEGK